MCKIEDLSIKAISLSPRYNETCLWDDWDGNTPLHLACREGNPDVIHGILDALPDDTTTLPMLLSLRDHLHRTPLHMAISSRTCPAATIQRLLVATPVEAQNKSDFAVRHPCPSPCAWE